MNIKMSSKPFLCRVLVSLLTAAFLLSVFSGTTVIAAEPIDLTADGSISITFTDSETDDAVSAGNAVLYHIAGITETGGEQGYSFTDEFSSCGLTLGDLSDETLVSKLVDFASKGNVSPAAIRLSGPDGKCLFEALEPGLYLLTQTEPAEGYYAINPFLVSVPILDTDGEWDYSVDATPKMERCKAQPDPEEPDEPDADDGTGGYTHGRSDSLPQTGQLNWPIPVFAGIGLLFIILGWVLINEGKKDA